MMKDVAPPVILIAGPTASGKSAVALELAERFGAGIINADSMQVYRDLRILTARPSVADESRVVHRLFGQVDGSIRYSVGGWAKDAAAALAQFSAAGLPAIVVGGTGLYFRALTEGLSAAPEIPPQVRAEAIKRLEAVGLEAFHKEVVSFDPAMSRLLPGDKHRNLRAWEVWRATGRPLSAIQANRARPIIDCAASRLIIEPSRSGLYRQIDERFSNMIASGAVDEVQSLRARGLPADMPVMKAVGVAEIIQFLDGGLAMETVISRAQQASRRYAKRQFTWFRNQTPDWPRVSCVTDAIKALETAF